MKYLAVLLLAFPALGATVITLGTNEFPEGPLAPGTFTTSSDPAPFNDLSGGDTTGNASFSFTFAFAVPVSPVTSASILLSLYELDSIAAGNQIGSFTLNGLDFTANLNAISEASPAANSTIKYLDLVLPASAYAQIQTGTVNIFLSFAGPGQGVLNPPTTFNGGGIDFAQLTYDTVQGVPEPSTFILAVGGGLAIYLRKRLV